MREWDLCLDFKAKVGWLSPPENTADQFRRDALDVRLNGQMFELAKRLEVYLTEWIIKNPEKELDIASLLEADNEK